VMLSIPEFISYTTIGVLCAAIIYIPDHVKNNSIINKFLEDNINVVLIAIVIILVSEINKVTSILLLLLFSLLLIQVHSRKYNTPKNINPVVYIEPMTMPTPNTVVLGINQEELNSLAEGGAQQQQLNHTTHVGLVNTGLPDNKVRECFVRSNVPVYPGRDVMGTPNPNYNITESPDDYGVPATAVIEKFTCNSLPLNDLPTQQLLKSSDGYDIAGCRYDNKNCAQNTTKYGSPLADCNTYDLKMAAEVGTVFYPLNA